MVKKVQCAECYHFARARAQYGDLELDRLIFYPGGAFPLSNVNLVLGAVTCSGKLSLVVEYEEGTVDTDTMIRIKDTAMDFLLQGDD